MLRTSRSPSSCRRSSLDFILRWMRYRMVCSFVVIPPISTRQHRVVTSASTSRTYSADSTTRLFLLRYPQIAIMQPKMTRTNHMAHQTPKGRGHACHSLTESSVGLRSRAAMYSRAIVVPIYCTSIQCKQDGQHGLLRKVKNNWLNLTCPAPKSIFPVKDTISFRAVLPSGPYPKKARAATHNPRTPRRLSRLCSSLITRCTSSKVRVADSRFAGGDCEG